MVLRQTMLLKFCVSMTFAFLLPCFVRGQNCTTNSPIPKYIIGKSFSVADSCHRPRFFTSAIAWNKTLTVQGTYREDCYSKFVFHFRNPDQVPYLVEGCDSDEEGAKNVYWPLWDTRPNFTEAVNHMVEKLENIRDFKCDDIEESVEEIQKRAIHHSGIDALISYLYGVAYKYGFCIE